MHGIALEVTLNYFSERLFLSAAEIERCQIELIGWMGG